MRELWSVDDEAALSRFCVAARGGDLLDAYLAFEGANERQRGAARAAITDFANEIFDVSGTPHAQLRAVLGQVGGFHSPAGVDPIAGSLLSEVLTSRQGLPLTISVIWIIVARAAHLRVHGVGLPGYFIARVVSAERAQLVDPGRGGDPLTEGECRQLIDQLFQKKITWRPEFLRSASVGAMLTRALNNLLNGYALRGDAQGRYRTVRFLCALHPGTAAVHLLHARIAQEVGAARLANEIFEHVISRFPGTPAAADAESGRTAPDELPVLH